MSVAFWIQHGWHNHDRTAAAAKCTRPAKPSNQKTCMRMGRGGGFIVEKMRTSNSGM